LAPGPGGRSGTLCLGARLAPCPFGRGG